MSTSSLPPSRRPMPGRFDAALVRYAHAIALRYVRNDDAAWDVTQDALLNAFRHQDSFRGDAAYSTWIYRIVTTTALMHLRSGTRRMREAPSSARLDGEPTALDLAVNPEPTPEQAVAMHESVARALGQVDRLGAKYGDIFRMRYALGFSETEIAGQLRATLPTVKTRAHRALIAARKAA